MFRSLNVTDDYVNKSRETNEHKLCIVITCIRISEVSLRSKCLADQR